jgi:hypothetical protein
LRRISISYQASLFIIVEGKVHDPYFIDKLCQNSEAIKKSGFEIRLIGQIASDGGTYAGGKHAVLDFFEHCKIAGKLVQRNKGGYRSIAFVVDRDTQQITGGMRRSPHVIYTFYADVEAHIFAESNEAEALAAAASLDSTSAADLLRSLGD